MKIMNKLVKETYYLNCKESKMYWDEHLLVLIYNDFEYLVNRLEAKKYSVIMNSLITNYTSLIGLHKTQESVIKQLHTIDMIETYNLIDDKRRV